MTDNPAIRLSADEWDEQTFPRPERHDFDAIVGRAMSRRQFLRNVVVYGSGAAVMSSGLLRNALAETRPAATSRFAFEPIGTFTDNALHLPPGYRSQVLARWGDPLFSDVAAFDHATGGSVEASDRVFGENTDGMAAFTIDGHQLIAINHEYTNNDVNLPHTEEGVPQNADDVRKLQNLQGVSVLEIEQTDDGWRIVTDSPFNRRLTHNSPMELVGPAAGHALLQTEVDPSGRQSLGTMNNCGSGPTPWGTYLTCEENFNGYFGSTDASFTPTDEQVANGYRRYGIDVEGWGYDYHKWDERFDTSKHPHEPHRVGWVVEIDPTRPDSTPVKHTGLGRFKHENAEVALARDGRVVVYMGDDERGEFMYRFVSNGVYVPGGPTDGLLDDGTLFAAKFAEDGTGEWLALTPETTGMEMAELLIFAREAASAVGATTMDRPEWIATNPRAIEGYCCLTNNSERGVPPEDDHHAQPVNAANPRRENQYGQIVRWFPHDDDHAADTFDWDLYVMAGNPTVHDDALAGSDNINEGNLFNSPDGMAFDSTGLVWIQTDGEESNEGDFAGMGNNQMLAGDPVSGRIERFLVGPSGCEVTGLTWSADRRTMFVGIQHPGGDWPDREGLPRSAVIAVQREDGGLIG